MKPKQVFISTGEISGNIHGAFLAKALWKINPNLKIFGMGTLEMANAGVTLIEDISPLSTIGLTDYFKYQKDLTKAGKLILNWFYENTPDFFILIDCEGFHKVLLKELKKIIRKKNLSTKVIYFILPQAWRLKFYGPILVRQLAQSIDLGLALFKEEYEHYRLLSAPVLYLGNPMRSVLPQSFDTDAFNQTYNLSPQKPKIALLPGSRFPEIQALMPLFLETIQIVSQFVDAEYLVLLSSERFRSTIETMIHPFSNTLTIIPPQDKYHAMKASDAALTCSGTATMELALIKVPMAITYKTSFLTWTIGKRIYPYKYIGLPNLMMNQSVAKEFLQKDASAENLANELIHMLKNKSYRNKILRQLDELEKTLPDNNLYDVFAQEMGHRFHL